MSWRKSLVRISTFNVDELRKRLAAVVDRREAAEAALLALHAERDMETNHAATDVEAGWYRLGYLEGWRDRRDAAEARILAIAAEETGARDALAEAFEELKKYEHIEEEALNEARKVQDRKDSAELDEVGARMAAKR